MPLQPSPVSAKPLTGVLPGEWLGNRCFLCSWGSIPVGAGSGAGPQGREDRHEAGGVPVAPHGSQMVSALRYTPGATAALLPLRPQPSQALQLLHSKRRTHGFKAGVAHHRCTPGVPLVPGVWDSTRGHQDTDASGTGAAHQRSTSKRSGGVAGAQGVRRCCRGVGRGSLRRLGMEKVAIGQLHVVGRQLRAPAGARCGRGSWACMRR